jgi:hypothetical protein
MEIGRAYNSMNVEYVTNNDIDEIVSFGEQCFRNMKLDKLGLNYCKKSHTQNMKRYINTDTYVSIKCMKDQSIIGFLSAYASPQIFNNDRGIMNVFTIQAKPGLPSITKGRVVNALRVFIEDICKKVGIQLINFQAMISNDLSKYLEKHNYKKGDILLYKEVI